LAALPAGTLVCCTHEYTMANLNFALAVERGDTGPVNYAVLDARTTTDEACVFAATRQWKNEFR
jgi:hypothetical protein